MCQTPTQFTSPLEGEVDRRRIRPEVASPVTGSAVGRWVLDRITSLDKLPPSLTPKGGGNMLSTRRVHSYISLG